MHRQIAQPDKLIGTLLLGVALLVTGCLGESGARISPAETQQQSTDLIRLHMSGEKGMPNDSVHLRRPRLVRALYQRSAYQPLWGHEQKWLSTADSLFTFIREARYYGLFPEDYHYSTLAGIWEKFHRDSMGLEARTNPHTWAIADLLLTDAFFGIVHDIFRGRLPADSLSEWQNNELPDSFFIRQFDQLQRGQSISLLVASLEPRWRGYHLLKAGIRKFLSGTNDRVYSQVPLPSRRLQSFRILLQRRLFEGGYLPHDSSTIDSLALAVAIKKFQQEKGLTADGVAGEATVRALNTNDRARFVRIAISLDKYKMLPQEIPGRYVWVNTSGNELELVENGQVKLASRVICGKPKTRTPLLTSRISEIITYPQWVPPPSIVSKEILPAVRKNPGYLSRKGFSLRDRDGNEVNADSVNWSSFKTMPYRVVQASGDGNALGVIKFVFSNKYSVYLHDTNQRYLFGNAMRSLSHGCVRVQEWERLASYLVDADQPGTTQVDSMKNWLRNKEKRSISLRQAVPVFIRYFTCAGSPEGIRFFDDVYGEDQYLEQKYFAGK